MFFRLDIFLLQNLQLIDFLGDFFWADVTTLFNLGNGDTSLSLVKGLSSFLRLPLLGGGFFGFSSGDDRSKLSYPDSTRSACT